MKKKFILIIGLMFLCFGCSSGDKSTNENNYKDYTFLIYMNGSDLESENNAGTTDLYEMMKVGSNDRINVVIETGGTKDWKNHYIDASQNQRWIVQKNHLEKLEDLGAKNMGQGETLEDFITWGIGKYPAEKYALILWNHGGGAISGFGYDEKFNYDTLLLKELQNALKASYDKTDTTFEIIGFDACLMASLETADMISPYGNYLVASTELEPSIGWEYSSFLQATTDNTLSGKELGTVIADGFYKASEKQKLDEFITLSVIDTGSAIKVKNDFEEFLKEANQELVDMDEYNSLSQTISKSEYYGGQTQEEGFSNMIDLGDIAKHLSSKYEDDKNKILESINKAVVYKISGKGKQESTGISVYFPYYGKENISYELPIYKNLEFSKTYNDFLQTYTDMMDSDNEVITTDTINKNNDNYKLTVDEKDITGIKSIHVVLGKEVTPNKILLFGGSPNYELDIETGTINTTFDGQWLTLDGHLMNFCVTKSTEDITTYSIPVILNDEYANIKVISSKNYKGVMDYDVVGAWHGVNPENMVIRKEIIRIKAGDKIEPIYQLYDKDSKQTESVNGDPFILEDPSIQLMTIEDKGNYVLGFCLDDCAQNRGFSEFIKIE